MSLQSLTCRYPIVKRFTAITEDTIIPPDTIYYISSALSGSTFNVTVNGALVVESNSGDVEIKSIQVNGGGLVEIRPKSKTTFMENVDIKCGGTFRVMNAFLQCSSIYNSGTFENTYDENSCLSCCTYDVPTKESTFMYPSVSVVGPISAGIGEFVNSTGATLLNRGLLKGYTDFDTRLENLSITNNCGATIVNCANGAIVCGTLTLDSGSTLRNLPKPCAPSLCQGYFVQPPLQPAYQVPIATSDPMNFSIYQFPVGISATTFTNSGYFCSSAPIQALQIYAMRVQGMVRFTEADGVALDQPCSANFDSIVPFLNDTTNFANAVIGFENTSTSSTFTPVPSPSIEVVLTPPYLISKQTNVGFQIMDASSTLFDGEIENWYTQVIVVPSTTTVYEYVGYDLDPTMCPTPSRIQNGAKSIVEKHSTQEDNIPAMNTDLVIPKRKTTNINESFCKQEQRANMKTKIAQAKMNKKSPHNKNTSNTFGWSQYFVSF